MKKILAVALLSTFVAAPTIALGEAYVGASVGSAAYTYSDTPDSVSSFGVIGGYGFSDTLAAEVAYKSFGESKITGLTNKVSASAINLSLVGTMPLGDAYALFGKIGFASVTTKASGLPNDKTAGNLSYGVGAQYNINKQIGIRAGYDIYKTEYGTGSANITDLSIGAIFKF